MKSLLFVALSVCACAATAQADFVSESPHALGGTRLYVGNLSYDTSSSAIFIDLELMMGGPALDPPAPGAPQRTSSMDGVVILSASIPGGSASPPNPYPLLMTVSDVFAGLSPGGETAFYDTEMLSLSIGGVDPLIGPFMIRESPTLPSLGGYSVETLPGGLFRIDSFFDVFTELSLDGGQSWIPSQSASHLKLVPEPNTITLLILGGLSVVLLRRKGILAARRS